MAMTMTQTEAEPEVYPEVSFGHPRPPADVIKAAWARIEAYTAIRFSPREVIWIVEGEGAWNPPLGPSTIETVEIWQGGAWVETALEVGPYGFELVACGPYRITATVGPAGEVSEVNGEVVTTYAAPAAVAQAARRLVDYSRTPGDSMTAATQMSIPQRPRREAFGQVPTGEGGQELEFERPATWMARALINSGAADLLRNYRRVS